MLYMQIITTPQQRLPVFYHAPADPLWPEIDVSATSDVHNVAPDGITSDAPLAAVLLVTVRDKEADDTIALSVSDSALAAITTPVESPTTGVASVDDIPHPSQMLSSRKS